MTEKKCTNCRKLERCIHQPGSVPSHRVRPRSLTLDAMAYVTKIEAPAA